MGVLFVLVSSLLLQGQPTAGTGTMTGRILSPLGQPLANAHVQAVKVGYKDGERGFVAVKSGMTSDLGEYRLFWLPPGTYYVNVLASGLRPFVVNASAPANSLFQLSVNTEYPAKRPPLGRVGEREADVPVYFPGTADGRSALPIDVRAGGEVRGIDIVARPVTTPRVRGAVVNDVTGTAEDGVQVILVPLNPVSGSPTAGYSAVVNSDRKST